MRRKTSGVGASLSLMLALVVFTHPSGGQTEDTQPLATARGFEVKGEVALGALLSLGDGHLVKAADSFQILAASDAARSGEWERIREPLADLGNRNVAALNWFASPDGSYWSVQEGREEGNLSGRDYWPKVLGGKTVLGELVISSATGMPVAIVAVPVFGTTGQVVGVLGASIYLDHLSDLIQRQLDLDETMIFYSFDHTGLVALNWDDDLIFFEPLLGGDQDLTRAFEQMLSKDEGVVAYRFRDQERTVLFRKSPVTEWWYAFGIVQEGRTP